MRIFIVGLRRSGTTIFWESFRRDPRFVAYDEPFNRILNELPEPEPKGTRDEWIALFRKDPKRFWQLFSPIDLIEELQEGFSDRQRAYFEYVIESAENVVVDMTRCHFKIEALHEVAPDAFLVHLYRPAAAWVSSHLAPVGKTWKGRVRTAMDRATFFERRRRYNYWGIEEIIANSRETLFGQRLAESGLDSAAVYAMPAIGRLLAYWKVFYERVERDGVRVFGPRFASASFPEFCRDPAAVIRRIYECVELEPPVLQLDAVHPPHGAFREDDPRWTRYATQLGISDESGLLFG